SVGQEIDIKIVDFKEDERKISLSRKDFEDDLVPDEPAEEAEEAVAETAEEAVEEVAAEAAEEATKAAEE
ncbi:MAG: 30S ribosomal protein S1, partial [Lachnospiraceae bacterium]|nr:30S ribosomal protein S1 [Lachnospiraceae bacterium]